MMNTKEQAELAEHMAELGRIGTGAAKRRGSKAFYRNLQAMRKHCRGGRPKKNHVN